MANKNTPENIVVPNSLWGIVAWAMGRWGVGAVFMAMVYFLYLDLRESNKQFSKLVEANTAAIAMFAKEANEGHAKVEAMKETVARIVGNTETILRSLLNHPPDP